MININNIFNRYFISDKNNQADNSKKNLSKFSEDILNIILGKSDFQSLKNLKQTSLFFNKFTENSQNYKDCKQIECFSNKIISVFKPHVNLIQFTPGDYSNRNRLAKLFLEEQEESKALMQCAGVLDIKLNNIIVKLDYNANIIKIQKSLYTSLLYPSYNPKIKCCYTSEAEVYVSKDALSDKLVKQAIEMAQKEIKLLLDKKAAEVKNLTY
jgi:hypothetical protein